jgi:hypothetical protein
MFASTTGIPFASGSSADPDDIVKPEPVETDAGGWLSHETRHWLAGLARPEQWVSSDKPRRHAEFLVDIVGALHGMGIFSFRADLFVSWAMFNRNRPATVVSKVLPGPGADAGSDAGSDVIGNDRRHPWITGFFAYDGGAYLGLGEVTEVDGQSFPVLHDSWPMRASQVFELAARVARRGHRDAGQMAPPCCDDGVALRSALVRHLGQRPDVAGHLARKFSLTYGFTPPPLSDPHRDANHRVSREQLQPGARAADYRVPREVLNVLVSDQVLRMRALRHDRVVRVASTLKISPTALRCAFIGQGSMPLTVLGAQCLHPELVRRTSKASRAEVGDRTADRATTAATLFENGEDLADALSRGILRSNAVRNLRWNP